MRRYEDIFRVCMYINVVYSVTLYIWATLIIYRLKIKMVPKSYSRIRSKIVRSCYRDARLATLRPTPQVRRWPLLSASSGQSNDLHSVSARTLLTHTCACVSSNERSDELGAPITQRANPLAVSWLSLITHKHSLRFVLKMNLSR